MYIVTETQVIKIFEKKKKTALPRFNCFVFYEPYVHDVPFRFDSQLKIEIDELFLFVSGALYSKLESVYSEVKTG